jgi:hypothetical protein
VPARIRPRVAHFLLAGQPASGFSARPAASLLILSLILERAQTASQALTDDFRGLHSGFAEGRVLDHGPLNARRLAVERFAHSLQMSDQRIDLAHLCMRNILKQ